MFKLGLGRFMRLLYVNVNVYFEHKLRNVIHIWENNPSIIDQKVSIFYSFILWLFIKQTLFYW